MGEERTHCKRPLPPPTTLPDGKEMHSFDVSQHDAPTKSD